MCIYIQQLLYQWQSYSVIYKHSTIINLEVYQFDFFFLLSWR